MTGFPKNGRKWGKKEEEAEKEVLTHTQNIEAETVANGLIYQLVGQAVKSYMARQRDSSAAFTLGEYKRG